MTAVEVDHELFTIAKEVLQLNNMSDKVKLINKHSTQLQVGPEGDIPDKADILERCFITIKTIHRVLD